MTLSTAPSNYDIVASSTSIAMTSSTFPPYFFPSPHYDVIVSAFHKTKQKCTPSIIDDDTSNSLIGSFNLRYIRCALRLVHCLGRAFREAEGDGIIVREHFHWEAFGGGSSLQLLLRNHWVPPKIYKRFSCKKSRSNSILPAFKRVQ